MRRTKNVVTYRVLVWKQDSWLRYLCTNPSGFRRAVWYCLRHTLRWSSVETLRAFFSRLGPIVKAFPRPGHAEWIVQKHAPRHWCRIMFDTN